MRLTTYFRYFILTFFLVAAGAWMLSSLARFSWAGVLEALTHSNAGYVALMALSWFSMVLVRPVRTYLLLRGLGTWQHIKYVPIFKATAYSFAANNFLPARLGDVLLAKLLPRSEAGGIRHVLPVILIEKIQDTLFAVISCMVGLQIAQTSGPFFHYVSVTVVIAISIAVVVLTLWNDVLDTCIRLAIQALFFLTEPFGLLRGKKSSDVAVEISRAFRLVRQHHLMATTCAIGIVFWAANILFFSSAISAILPDGPGKTGLLCAGLVALGFALPITPPGGFGIFHGLVVLALAAEHVPLEKSITVAILAHGLPVALSIVLAVLVFLVDRLLPQKPRRNPS